MSLRDFRRVAVLFCSGVCQALWKKRHGQRRVSTKPRAELFSKLITSVIYIFFSKTEHFFKNICGI